MLNLQRQLFFWIGGIVIILFLSIFYVFAGSEQATVTFTIKGIGIRHGTPNNVNLGTPTTSSSDQEISGQFTDNFRIEDLQGYITGHYTTIQCDGIYGSAGNTLTGIYLKAGNSSPTLSWGITGNVHISTELTNYVSILTPVTYLYKPTDIINQSLINTYGDNPWLKIIIPGETPPGTYSGTIVFSLYTY